MKAVLGLVYRLENTILMSVLITMIFMAVMQIVLRNLLGGGVVWAESLLRVLVLWVALLGAMVATRDKGHISIDIAARYLPERLLVFVNTLVSLFSAGICGVVFWYSLAFVRIEYEDQTIAFASVPTWLCESIIPFAFLIMSLRFVGQAFLGLSGNGPPEATRTIR